MNGERLGKRQGESLEKFSNQGTSNSGNSVNSLPDSERLSSLLKITQPEGSKARFHMWLQNECSISCVEDGHPMGPRLPPPLSPNLSSKNKIREFPL